MKPMTQIFRRLDRACPSPESGRLHEPRVLDHQPRRGDRSGRADEPGSGRWSDHASHSFHEHAALESGVPIPPRLIADARLAGSRGSGSQSLLVRVILAIRGFNGLFQDEVRPPSRKGSSAREDAKTLDPIGFLDEPFLG